MQGGLKRGKARRRLSGAMLAGISASGLVAGSPAHAQVPAHEQEQAQDTAALVGEERARFRIPAQPLSSALSVFGQQAGLQVSVNAAAVRGLSAPALSGELTRRGALGRLLAGSGLAWRSGGPRTVIVYAPGQAAGTANVGDTTVLDPVVLSSFDDGSGYQGTPDWVYSSASSVSVVSRELIEQAPARNTRDLLDTVSGVYVNRSEGQNPGIAINIRGLQDQNRVVTMVDGARQNFQRSGHGASQRAYVDTAFIREIDVEKAATTGVGGAGALGGTVNFRTLEAGDIIEPGRTWGVEASAGAGTNALDFDGSLTAAARVSERFSVIAGISHKKVGSYDVGKNGNIELWDDFTYVDGAVVFTGQDVLTTFLKGEAELGDSLKFTLSWMRNRTDSSQGSFSPSTGFDEDLEEITNNTIVARADWNPDSDLVDLKASLWYNHLANDETRGYVLDPDVLFPVDYAMATIGGSLENTSRFDVAFGALSVNYGMEMFHDDGTTQVDSGYLATAYPVSDGGIDLGGGFNGTNPNGRRTMLSGFANVTLEHDDWLTLSGGLRYDHSRLWGSTTIYGNSVRTQVPCDPGDTSFTCRRFGYRWVNVYPGADLSVDRSDGALLPNAMVTVQPFDWLQTFARFSQSYRAPSVMEALIAGGHPPPALPVNNAPNPDLKPEQGNTYEIGANVSRNGMFSAEDGFRMKAVAFYREIEDYISMGTVHRAEFNKDYTSYVNVDGTTRMSGVEIEASYDAGLYYLGGAFTWLHTDFGSTYTYQGVSQPVEPSVIFVPPEFKVTLDAGVRLLDRRLTLGARMNHVGGTNPGIGSLASGYVTSDYTLVDLYGSLRFNDHARLRFGVNNLTDIAYVPALGAESLPAPGRTITASFNVKF